LAAALAKSTWLSNGGIGPVLIEHVILHVQKSSERKAVEWAPSRPRMRRSICSILDVAHDATGPLPTFTKINLTATRHTKSGHSCTLQHFRPRRSASRDIAAKDDAFMRQAQESLFRVGV
jgi:hypothetical protein